MLKSIGISCHKAHAMCYTWLLSSSTGSEKHVSTMPDLDCADCRLGAASEDLAGGFSFGLTCGAATRWGWYAFTAVVACGCAPRNRSTFMYQ
eukprot:m.333927 g.333927  ORF g.333927 m.333927 type:complete len:92 (+) comp16067_c0_seq13:143-418(+)